MSNLHGENTFHAEDGSLTQITEFDYDAIDRNLAPQPADLRQNDIEAAATAFQSFARWIWQDGKKNPEGVQLRAMIIGWVFIPELRPLTLTDLATGFGKKKQSLGRWVDELKRDFPSLRTPHMVCRSIAETKPEKPVKKQPIQKPRTCAFMQTALAMIKGINEQRRNP